MATDPHLKFVFFFYKKIIIIICMQHINGGTIHIEMSEYVKNLIKLIHEQNQRLF